ncbi:MAG: citramalate synthase, partial [Spirochaetes bacterium]|nr:citramalate synthase [Spirochaetota bacterium]
MVQLFDTTLRDGTQGEKITFSSEDKVRVAKALDDFGIHYIEGGWPGSNPKDIAFFKKIKKVPLKQAKITAFGSTRRSGNKPEHDPNLKAITDAGTPVATIFGKTWDLHVKEALRVTLKENLAMIEESVTYLKSRGLEVIYDAEHFFNGYKKNPSYALESLEAAARGKADIIVLCDTNGGTLPHELEPIFKEVQKHIDCPLGIHAHNDSGVGVALTIEAVNQGAVHVQGTFNGYGERCGNANLCSIIPILKLKMGIDCVSDENLRNLASVSRYISELTNLTHDLKLPFVGESAFAHKGGIHVDAVMKDPETYEHIDPELVGNARRV